MRWMLSGAIGLLAAGWLACGSETRVCQDQTDCRKDFTCVAGTCVKVTPGRTGSASGAFSTARVDVHGGALEVFLANGQETCASNVRYQVAPGLSIVILPTNRAGSLALGTFNLDETQILAEGQCVPSTGGQPVCGDSPVAAQDAFAAFLIDVVSIGGMPFVTTSAASAGSLTLTAAPDYDSGFVTGSYQLTIKDEVVSGDFRTAYCFTDRGVDAPALGSGLYDNLAWLPDLPLAPGATHAGAGSTFTRDQRRGMTALGLDAEQGACLDIKVEMSADRAWANNEELQCFRESTSRCVDPSLPIRPVCIQ